MARTRRLKSFSASDAKGKAYTIDVLGDVIQTEVAGAVEDVVGQKSLRLRSGEDLNLIQKGEYEVVVTGGRLFSSDPNAE